LRAGFEAALQAAGIPFAQAGRHVNVTLHGNEQIDRYIEIAKRIWSPVFGMSRRARWVFIFADEDGIEVVPFDSVEADQVILAHCSDWNPVCVTRRTVMEMLWSAEFYRDVLFHAEYGAMINSGAFTGTPGDQAKPKVTQWLEQHGVGQHAVTYRLHDWVIRPTAILGRADPDCVLPGAWRGCRCLRINCR